MNFKKEKVYSPLQFLLYICSNTFVRKTREVSGYDSCGVLRGN